MDSSTHEVVLENMIMSNLGFAQLRGFPEVCSNTFRQFRLPYGKVCDIFSYDLKDNQLTCRIFELKRGEIGIPAALQLIQYGEIVARHSHWAFDKVCIRLYLIGAELHDDLFGLLAWGLNLNILTYDYKFDGIRFIDYGPIENFPPPMWLSRPNEMITKPTETEINDWIKKLKGA